jgi:SAM-dependent methyltransferase
LIQHDGMTYASNPTFWSRLRCPVDGAVLERRGDQLICERGDAFAVVDEIPVLLRSDVAQTHPAAERSLAHSAPEISEPVATAAGEIDPFVQHAMLATNGYMYRSLLGRLHEYPIPRFPIAPRSPGELLLDVGCNWGRWCVAAARAGFHPVGIDPSLSAIRAARRVARQVGVTAEFLVADGRFLPFSPRTFDVVYSYSVWQHFQKVDTIAALGAAARVLREDGRLFVQMANAYGLRSLYHQVRRGFREPRNFEVRYWRPTELRDAFRAEFPLAELSADGFFSLNPQAADAHLLPRRFRLVIHASDLLRRASRRHAWLTACADSVFVSASRAVS